MLEHTAKAFADPQPEQADDKGDGADDDGGGKRRWQLVSGESKPYRERVDAGGDRLHQQDRDGEAARFFLFSPAQRFDDHLDPDEQEEYERDIRHKAFDHAEPAHQRGDQHPAEHRHQKLENAVGARNGGAFEPPHLRFAHAVGNRYRKGVHRQPDAEEYGVKEKQPHRIAHFSQILSH